jgi:hypothetical protein
MSHARIHSEPKPGRRERRLVALDRDPRDVDRRAVEAYEAMLREAPSTRVEQAHIDAFERLTPQQLDLHFLRAFGTESPDGSPEDGGPGVAADEARSRRPRPFSRFLTLLGNAWPGAALASLGLAGASGFIIGAPFPSPILWVHADGRSAPGDQDSGD